MRGAIEALTGTLALSVRDDGGRLHLTAGAIAEADVAKAEWLPDDESRTVAPLAIPDAIGIAYYEPARDYQAGLQRATRGGPGRRMERIELPVTIGAGMAKAIAESKLASDWAGRERRQISLCWRTMALRPGMILSLEGEAGLWRIAQWTLEGMAVKLALIRMRSTEGGAIPAAEPGRGTHQPDAPHGATLLHLLDLPDLAESGAVLPRVHAAAAGEISGWRRATLSLSLDSGVSWSDAGSTAAPAVIGVAAGLLAGGPAVQFDDRNQVEIVLAHDGMALADASDDRMIAGAKLALLGDELIQFGRAMPLSTTRYRLSRLLRGRRGTEHAINAHGEGERFVLIAAETLAPIEMPLTSLGGPVRLMASGIGDDGAVFADVASVATCLRPPSPVALTVRARGDGGFDMGWTRRSRLGWRWTDGVDAPLGEEREAYRIEIVTGSGTIRIAETAVPGFHYDAAMVAADGGTGGVLDISVTQTGSFAASLPARLIFSDD